MFPRAYKVIPQTPTLPIDMTLYHSPMESTPKVGWLPSAILERDEYFVEDDYQPLRPPVSIVLEHRQADTVHIYSSHKTRSITDIHRLEKCGSGPSD